MEYIMPFKKSLSTPEVISSVQVQFDCGTVMIEENNQLAELKGVIICPANSAPNHQVNSVNQLSVQWAVSHGLINHEKINVEQINKLEAQRFAALAPTALNGKTPDDLQLMTDYLTLVILVDDILDKEFIFVHSQISATRLLELEDIFKSFIQALSGNLAQENKIHNFPLFRNIQGAFFDISQRIKAKNYQNIYFTKSVNNFFKGCLWELKNRLVNASPSKETHLYLRKFTVLMRTVFELTFILNGIAVPDDLRNNPIFKRITLAAINSVAILNDIASLRNEIREGNQANLILIKLKVGERNSKGQGNLLQKCIDSAVKKHNKEMKDFITLQRFLPDGTKATKDSCLIMANCLRDHINWCFLETKTVEEGRNFLPTSKL
jgi:Terpene synthase family 2, C-terminal metal binding